MWEDRNGGGWMTSRGLGGKIGYKRQTERHGKFWKRPISRSGWGQAEK